MLTCPILGALALVTLPKFELVKLPDGLPNWAWLNALKNSARICTDHLSVIRVSLCTAKSQLLVPGPWKNRRFALPNFPSGPETKAPFSK